MAQKMTTIVSAPPLVLDLNAEIKAIVKLHASRTRVPPFSSAELAVMAWVCCKIDLEIVTEKQIFKWVVKKFRYYADLAAEDSYNLVSSPKRRHRTRYLQVFYNNMASELFLHEVPMYPICVELDSDDDDVLLGLRDSQMYISTLVRARTFLRRALGNETREFRRFLDLPVEIRLMIYAEVFRYEGKIEFTNPMLHLPAPRRAIRNTSYSPQHVRDHTYAFDEDLCTLPAERDKVTGLSGEIMSLLLVNRQIFEEAMPVFYNINTFHVKGIQDLARMLRLCGARRRVYFSRIDFEHRYSGTKDISKKVFKMLAEVKQLQHFTVRANDEIHLRGYRAYDADDTAWMDLLCDLKCLSVELLGDCPRIEAYMQEYRAKRASEAQQAEAENGKPVKPSKRCKKVFKSEAVVHDD